MSTAAPPTPPAGIAEPEGRECVQLEVERWRHGTLTRERDLVAEEMPVALVYHGVPHVVMLATPSHLEDYAVGFTLSEGLVAHPDEIRGVEAVRGDESAEVRITVAWERFAALLDRRRNLTGRSGCGLCGQETVEHAVREVKPVGPGARLSAAELHQAIAQLADLQPINARTGSVHAAAWIAPGKGIQVVREDVGRHNALDKTIGALVRSGVDPSGGALLLTSRASFELVQKSAAVGVAFFAAFSAPTAFAVRLAERAGMTLVAFAREHRHVVYAHPWRLESQ
ncbi:MAG TPA: formate dehydrogenase accessory sulfurtransferase FdhD [Steroidobacteraceae bacterium]|nr:formate dehydrogenase accessory sulfurtransferase FdhD [Steroidobacteraceae bacterium]